MCQPSAGVGHISVAGLHDNLVRTSSGPWGTGNAEVPTYTDLMAYVRLDARATVEERVRSIEIRPAEQNTVLAYEIEDLTGHLTALFYGRSHIAGVYCGSRLRLSGRIGTEHGRPVITNPAYQLLADGEQP
jgi:RecG-like helicase